MTPIFQDDRDQDLLTDLAALSTNIDGLLNSNRSFSAVALILAQISSLATIYCIQAKK